MKGKQQAMQRVVLGGVARRDVSRALSELAKRNLELTNELAAARESEQELLERATAAEDTLETFHGLLQQASHLLAMAEDRAREVRVEAERDAARIRAEVDGLHQELEQLSTRKVQAMDDLVRLGDPVEPEQAPLASVTVLTPPEPAPTAEPSLEELFLQHVEANTRS